MSINRSSDTNSKKVRAQYNQNVMEKGLKIPTGVYRGVVVDVNDPNKMGRVKVHIMKFYGTFTAGQNAGTNIDPEDYLGAMWCRQLMPFGGTSTPAAGPNGVVSQNAYGMHGQPPSLDNEVLVAFSGDTHSGIILGVLPDPQKIDGLAGAGVTGQTASGETTIRQERSKTTSTADEQPDEHPLAEILRKQGLDKDRIRGQNYSSPTRDPSSQVMGMTTPVGHSITMDDGDGEDQDNLGMRLRTAGGAQILMDDTNGMTYINNREGNVWVEMNRNGDIDIYAGNSINIATQGDFNFNCGGSFNLNAGRAINMKSGGATGIKLEAASGSVDIFAHANLNLQADANGNLRVAGNYRETAGRIDMNGAPALAASKPAVQQHAGNTNITESIAGRVPEAEPWNGHLDVSVLDSSSASGATAQGNSNSYYYGSPTDMHSYNDQTGDFDINNYPVAEGETGAFVQYRSGVDKRIDPALITMVEEIARRFGRPLVITSGYRSPSRNTKAGGAKYSQHMLGKAVDISGGGLTNNDRLQLVAIASSVGIKGIGVYNGGSLHFDNRDSSRAGWGSDYTSNSVPSYAVTTINKHKAGGFA